MVQSSVVVRLMPEVRRPGSVGHRALDGPNRTLTCHCGCVASSRVAFGFPDMVIGLATRIALDPQSGTVRRALAWQALPMLAIWGCVVSLMVRRVMLTMAYTSHTVHLLR